MKKYSLMKLYGIKMPFFFITLNRQPFNSKALILFSSIYFLMLRKYIANVELLA